ncbi:hypothetical protein JNB_12973 [Janibacter sp. HTCC2649]|nr:hypothetical protein JNB_12973 [Janibacter sp. HTCC2649]
MDVRSALERIFIALGGDLAAQAGKRSTPLQGDFVDPNTGTFIEIDESQHFTSFRATSLMLYPRGVLLGFDYAGYVALCARLAPRSDRYRASKAAVGFGAGGRQRQRAYHDALRDLLAPAFGQPPVIRIPVLDGGGAAAYARERDQIRERLNTVVDGGVSQKAADDER